MTKQTLSRSTRFGGRAIALIASTAAVGSFAPRVHAAPCIPPACVPPPPTITYYNKLVAQVNVDYYVYSLLYVPPGNKSTVAFIGSGGSGTRTSSSESDSLGESTSLSLAVGSSGSGVTADGSYYSATTSSSGSYLQISDTTAVSDGIGPNADAALSANMRETPSFLEFTVEGERGMSHGNAHASARSAA